MQLIEKRIVVDVSVHTPVLDVHKLRKTTKAIVTPMKARVVKYETALHSGKYALDRYTDIEGVLNTIQRRDRWPICK